MAATKDQVAQIIVGEAKARNHTRDECLAELSGLYQESGWDETIWDPTHTTYGVAQQDGSYPNRFQGAAAQVKAFFDKLDIKRASPGHGDIWLNICWLQQAPNWPSAQYWWDNGRQAYLTEIKSRIGTVTPYLDKYWPTGEPVTTPDNRPDFNEIQQWSPNSSSRGGTTIDAIFIHTSDGVTGDNAARDLTAFLCNPANQVSYHYAASQASDGGVTVYDVVDTDEMSWSVLSANARSINYCFAGSFAAWTRAQWLQQSKAIDVVAYLVVQDCKKYGIPTKVIAPPYTGRIPGISDHRYVTKVLGDGTHTDVGDNFPWDVFTAAVAKYAEQVVTPPVVTPPVVTPPVVDPLVQFNQWVAGATDRELLEYITRQIGPGDPAWQSKNKTLRDKVFGV
jgi:N-acetyl-anhydromuramyl-L-alanine amidase AmpD